MNYKSVYRRTISDENWVIPFGKYKGLPLIDVMDKNPEYLVWCMEKDMLDLDHKLISKMEEMNPWMKKDLPDIDEVMEASAYYGAIYDEF